MKPLNVCLLSHVKPGFANTCFDHENALSKDSAHNVVVISPLDYPATTPDFTVFDVVIIHYSIITFSPLYLPPIYRRALQSFTGLKIVFIQDEYRTVFQAIDAMIELGIDVLFTCVPEANIDRIYGQLRRRGVRIETTLTGYVADNLLGLRPAPLRERPLDVTYRGRTLPYTLGKLGQEKVFIAREFNLYAGDFNLKTDIGWREQDRIYGDAWIQFMCSGRAVLGTESGASICDFTGEIDRCVQLYLLEHPNAAFEEVFDALLAPYEGNAVINTISPRAFEAIALGTVLVQFPGSYSGILESNRHYIPLEKDFSNITDVAAQLQDLDYLEAMTRRAREEIIDSGNYAYQKFSREVDTIIYEEWERRVYRHPIIPPGGSVGTSPENQESRRPESKLELNALVTASLAPAPIDVAQASTGASIYDSSPFFGRPHDADYLLRVMESEGYAAVLGDVPLPHWITIDFGSHRTIDTISLQWYDDLHFCTSFVVETSLQLDRWTTIVNVTENEQVSQRICFEPVTARYLRLTGFSFSGQPRLLIKRCQVFASNVLVPVAAQDTDAEESAPELPNERSGVQFEVVHLNHTLPLRRRLKDRLFIPFRQRRS
jgi:hypothetical protein